MSISLLWSDGTSFAQPPVGREKNMMNKAKFISMLVAVVVWTYIIMSAVGNNSISAGESILASIAGGAAIGILHAFLFPDAKEAK